MNDTSPEMASRYLTRIMAKMPEERLRMGCSMFDGAKRIAIISIRDNSPSISHQKIKEEIFLRFYGLEFTAAQKEKIISMLRS